MPPPEVPLERSSKPSIFERIGISTFDFINRSVPWFSLPSILGAVNLAFLRVDLRSYNLYDGYASSASDPAHGSEPVPERYKTARHSGGKYNSLEKPRMGCAGMRLGRNFPRSTTGKPTEEELMTPNPRLVSERFMRRREGPGGGFKPATTLNLLAAAWIQFQTHDWFAHEDSTESHNIPLTESDTWGDAMTVLKTKPDDTLDPSDVDCPGYKNKNTAWWDGSQIYGSDEALTNQLRNEHPDGMLLLEKKGTVAFLPRDEQGNPQTGFRDNWWVGMELLHTLFALEHNSICEALRAEYPDWTGDQIFDKARLVNCALMAKIHTVEWTPAILATATLRLAMNANWWGLVGERLTKALGRIHPSSSEISGIPGSGVVHDGAPYSLTEEFTSVYRMHSLLPDSVAFFSSATGDHIRTYPMAETAFSHASDPLSNPESPAPFADALYSFGINYPGAITNNNYPNFLMDLTTPDGLRRDLGTVDILRDRERGVPRYCAFRRMLRMSVPKTFMDVACGDEALAKDLEEVYGKVELVDALVGSHCEKLIPGFGFSETAFRIFIVMASRRLKSDRFIAGSWNEETYTKIGFKWVQDTEMKDILGRHFPELKETLAKSQNVFAPWAMLEGSKAYDGIETNAPGQ